MQLNRKFTVTAAMVMVITIAVAFTTPRPEEEHTNLKILPKDISHEALDKIMDGFEAALGVKCDFCHAAAKNNPGHLDFASDEKGEKGVARYMMKMTMRINKKFFEVKHPMIGDSTLIVTCNTCHHGEPHPEQKKETN
jgi:Photosynthetic reaction centre cytochrome C subunit